MLDAGWTEERPDDRRQAIRRRTRRKVDVVVNRGWSTFGAQILNMSADGALLELDGSYPVPEFFQLRYDGVKKSARRVWTRSRAVGVAFE
jgi:hypothetical protein